MRVMQEAPQMPCFEAGSARVSRGKEIVEEKKKVKPLKGPGVTQKKKIPDRRHKSRAR